MPFRNLDPAGVDAGRKIEQTLRELAANADIHLKRVAVPPVQIVNMALPSQPPNQADGQTGKGFGATPIELDAILP